MPMDPHDVELCIDDGIEPGPGRPTSTPVVQTSLFTYPTLAALSEALAAEHRHPVYTRGQNPTVEVLERKLAALERGEACKAFGSGMAAVSAVFLGLLEAGDHVVFFNHVYGPTLQLAQHLRRFGIEHTVVRSTALDDLEAALRPATRLIWTESPGTMLFRVVDLAAIAALGRSRGITTAIDNSWCTPLFQKPLTLGFDLVMHTATKYLGGHSDVVAGAVVGDAERLERIFYRAFLLNGGILHPWDAWLLLRGLRTLPTRMERIQADGMVVARHLARHPAVTEVHHPGLAPRPPFLEAQMTGHAGVFSFRLADPSGEAVRRVVDGLRLFRIGVSWGGVESLALSPQRGDDAEARAALERQGLPPGLIRISVGLEGADALVADLDQALAGIA